MKIKLLTVAMLSTTLFLTACGGDDNGSTVFVPKPEIPENNIKDPVVGIPKNYELNGMADAAASSNSVVMTYKMLGVNNKEVFATALVFTPPASVMQPTNGWPIVVWAHGTTGVADKCAPSRQGLGGNEVLLKALLASGYVVVAPDYEGLGEPSEQDAHPFLNVKSEAYSITDAVVATRAYLTSLNKKTNGQWLAVGHSQGGQAVLGAAQYASRAKLDYKGTVAVAPASNLALILAGGENQANNEPDPIKKINILAPLDTFTALITAGLRNQYPNLKFTDVFNSPTDLIAATAETSSQNSVCYYALGQNFGNAMGAYLNKNKTFNKSFIMATTSDIKNGLCIKYNNDIYKIIEFLHVKPGKGPAFVRTKLKSLTNGKVLDNTFSAGHKIDVVRVETHTFQYLYAEGNDFHFMNTETYEQITLNKDVLDAPDLLKEGTNVMVQINTETDLPLAVDMPASIVLEVTYAEPGVKGNTATNATKPAKVETGASINVPLFINEGDKIKIDTATGKYMERV